MRNYFFLFILVFSALIITNCSEDSLQSPSPVDNNNNGFANKQVANIFATSCAASNCHTGVNAAGGLSIDNYSDLLKGSINRDNQSNTNYGGEAVIPYNSDKSLLYQMIMGNVTPLSPHDAVSLSDSEKNIIKNWIDDGAKDFNGNVPFSNPSYRVYVCNQAGDAVSVIDGDAKVVSRIIDVDFNQSIDAPHMVKERDGFLYVTLIGDGKFLKYRTDTFEKVGEVNGIEKAGMIWISPDGNKAYVSRSSTSSPIYTSIFAVNINNMTVIKEIEMPISGVPHGIALTSDGTKLYVANLTQHRISVIDAVNDEYDHDIVLPQDYEPMQANISPDSKYLYICERHNGKLLVIDTQTENIIQEVQLDPMPMHIAVTNDGNKIYIASMGASVVDIVTKNGTTWSKTGTISHPYFNMLHGCDLTADGKYLYVSSRNQDGMFKPTYVVGNDDKVGNVGIIDTQTNQVIKVIEVEDFGAGLVVEK